MKKRYSHIDLLHMIDGVEMQKATAAAGNRCYYLKVWACTFSRMCIDNQAVIKPSTCLVFKAKQSTS